LNKLFDAIIRASVRRRHLVLLSAFALVGVATW